MQLVGKLALSATAAFILALAFRFYKSRVHERRGVDNGSGPSGYLDVGAATGGHVNDETNELRCRRGKRTQHSDVISAAGSQSLAGDPVTAQEFNSKSQKGPQGLSSQITEYQSADVITHQSNLNLETPETRTIPSRDQKCHREGLSFSAGDVGKGNGIGTIRDNSDSWTVQSLNDPQRDISDPNGIETIRNNLDSGRIQPLKDSGKKKSDPNGIETIRDNLDSGTIQPLKDSGKKCSDPNGIETTRNNSDSGTVQTLKYSGKDISDPNGIETIRDNSDSWTVQSLNDPRKDIFDPNGIETIKDNLDSGTIQPLKVSGKDIFDPIEIETIRENVDSDAIQPLKVSNKDVSDPNEIETTRDNSDSGSIQSLKGIVTTLDNSHSETVQPVEGFAKDISDIKGTGTSRENSNSRKIQPLEETGKDICHEKEDGTFGGNADSGVIQPLKKSADLTTVANVDSGNIQPLKDVSDEAGDGTTWDNHRQDPEVKDTRNVDSACVIQDLQASSGVSSALNENHKTMQEVHRFSSVSRVVVEENIISERQAEESRTSPRSAGLRGKIYEYHIESTSETVSPGKHFKFRASTSPSSHPQAKSQQDQQEVKVGLWEQGQDQYGAALGSTGSQEALEVKGNPTPSGLISPLRSLALKPANGNSTFHISLSPESTFDVHLGLENCFEVLSLAKKHDLDALKTAAYKVMSDNYLDVLRNPSIYGRLHSAERDLILEQRMRGRKYVVVADIDTVGYSVSENSSLSYYDSDQDSWHLLCPIPPEAVSRACSMATMFNYIFIVLGCQGLEREMKPSKRVVCYNPVTGKWQDICPLNEARPHCKLVELDGYLYAIGGECLHTVERYDPRQNRWSYVAPLPNDTFAVAHMATAYDDEIYVTGGTIRYMLLRYLRKDNTWKSSIITGSKDRTTELVAANNFLYRFDMNRSMGISVHRCSVRARIWYECATYTMPYHLPFQCAVIDNNIYCISRNFHLRFLTNDISPRFMEDNLKTLPCPKGLLSPLVLVLPEVDSQ
ncbi:hypothetical protein XELAEV_18036404mg [Xenopus laevis]|uniref:Kelch domain-containing protein 7A n=1 Tax=Xenopus laevis TaxID=8355 RepID=A0A974HD00_XENLA|nr:hypothetical protein XELAEV_18036404mg [Xenopus laevis]